jgi:hypothetical protein
MANHVRRQVRDAFIALLSATAATAAGSRVYGNRVAKVTPALCPLINVRTPGDQASPGSFNAPALVERVITVDVLGYIAVGSDADDAADELARQIEAAIDAAPGLGLGVGGAYYEGTAVELDDLGPGEVGAIRVRYTVRGITRAPDAFA